MNRVTRSKALVGALEVPAGGLTMGGAVQGSIVKFSQTIPLASFTDGGGASGTFAITAGTIPAGAYFLCCLATAVTGFAGDSSATVIIGDGTDTDRYNTGTPSVFATAANGVSLGDPSGTRYHTAAVAPVVTVTSGSDFGSVTAGSIALEFYYLT